MSQSRRGFTIVESCVAAGLLAAALAALVSLLTSVARQRQAADLHAQASIAADNLLERIAGEPYDAIRPERAEELARAANLAEALPDGAAELRVADAAGSPPGKQIELELTWRATGAGPLSRHRLATWVFRAEKP